MSKTTGTFRQEPLGQLPRLERVEGEYRTYRKPDGVSYPSVTTVLAHTLDKSGLDEWRSRVGDAEADRIMRSSGRRGTVIHSLCEDLVMNRPVQTEGVMPINLSMYRQIERVLRSRLDVVNASEAFLYSDKLRVAGACDLIGTFDGRRSIVDFKNSRKWKLPEYLEGYWLQTAMYSYCLWERTGRFHKNLVVVVAVEDETEAQVESQDVNDWIDRAHDHCKKFHKTVYKTDAK